MVEPSVVRSVLDVENVNFHVLRTPHTFCYVLLAFVIDCGRYSVMNVKICTKRHKVLTPNMKSYRCNFNYTQTKRNTLIVLTVDF